MNKSKEIFQEIENKLVKDDYASSLPTYHPAKGRRKRVLKEPERVYQTKGKSSSGLEGQHPKAQGQEGFPDTLPEIEEPDEEEIQPDFPGPEIDLPEEEEIPEKMPDPEYEHLPDEEELGSKEPLEKFRAGRGNCAGKTPLDFS
ncbi:MAG: hypothetical protein WD426_17735 [Anditalea sp.]